VATAQVLKLPVTPPTVPSQAGRLSRDRAWAFDGGRVGDLSGHVDAWTLRQSSAMFDSELNVFAHGLGRLGGSFA
jgi:hypothetical protein